MSSFFNNIANIGRKLNKYDPLDRSVQNFVYGRPNPGTNYYGEPSPVVTPPGPPSQDTAANAALAQQDQLRRRRGVLANIFAGGGSSQPTVTKSALGN